MEPAALAAPEEAGARVVTAWTEAEAEAGTSPGQEPSAASKVAWSSCVERARYVEPRAMAKHCNATLRMRCAFMEAETL